ncbi:MAG: tetratricopeptide repeat protein [Cyanobacteria bacterium RU_5_0]|nr:tetratricopeptide repeat protein [Cyanobacteria bacterium RU_5_0]
MGFNFLKIFQASQSIKTPTKTGQRSSSKGLGYRSGQAIVEQAIHSTQRGRVRFWGSAWFARCNQDISITSGEIVDVLDIDNITLIVEPAFLLAASTIGLTKIRQIWRQLSGAELDATNLEADAELIEQLVAQSQGDLSETAAIETWKRFFQGKPIYVTKFKICCKLLGLNWQEIVGYGNVQPEQLPQPLDTVLTSNPQTVELTTDASSELIFVGRERVMADLDRLTQLGKTAVTILGKAGVGKTTVAQHYFQEQDFELVLEWWIAKQTQSLTSAESIVQVWLRQHFGEEPGREFHASLEQLRQRLQERPSRDSPKIGVLIDNLETALDRNGYLVEDRRDYVELLELLADPSLHSLTLITSREPIYEPRVAAHAYVLPNLDLEAWRQFFSSQQIPDSPVLAQIHKAYGGNAKAMTIISSTISIDYAGSLEVFWQERQADLLREANLSDLLAGQFDRLQHLYPEAHRLLLRLGCHRYQNIAAIPLESVVCLLWDVPEPQHNSVIRFLEDLFLVEVNDGKYNLHPMVQANAAKLLRASPDWELANRRAAECWTSHVKSVETIEDALSALEAYYHYLKIDDPEAAATVLLHRRDSPWEKQEPLGVSFHRLGLLRRMISAIAHVINRIEPGYNLSKLSSILGDSYWLIGNIHQAISWHQRAREVAIEFGLRDLEIVSLFNLGLCKIQLWEISEALKLFNEVSTLAENTDCHMYAVGAWFCLAFVHSCLGHKQEAKDLVRKVSNDYITLNLSSWSRGYSLIFLGWTLRNLGDNDRAVKLYNMAIDYAEKSLFTQVKGRAMNGLGAVCRDRQDFRGAIANHQAAKNLLERIEAKGDLAEVYVQLGLTYQKMNELTESRMSLQKSIDLFREMDAPKQVERVQRVLESVTQS